MGFWDKLFGGSNDDWEQEDRYFRERHAQVGSASSATDADYDRYRPAYQLGWAAGSNERYRGRNFADVETELRNEWTPEYEHRYGAWDNVRGYVGDAYQRGQERTITRSEEELAVGKRQVAAGEVGIHKRVETERVETEVPLMREEITVERRPVEARDATAADLRDEDIRVAATREEAVVEKRPVVKEEIVVRKNAVEDSQRVAADLRKERVDVEDNTTTRDRLDTDATRLRDEDLRDR